MSLRVCLYKYLSSLTCVLATLVKMMALALMSVNSCIFDCVLGYYGNDCETSMYIYITIGLLRYFRVHICEVILQIYLKIFG